MQEKKRETHSYSIDKEMYKKFSERCSTNCTNMSRLIESLIKKYLEEKNGKKR